MIPKDRVLTAVSHKEPDRVPIGEWEYDVGIVEPVLKRKTFFLLIKIRLKHIGRANGMKLSRRGRWRRWSLSKD
ncbi:hypothetical protein KAW55_02135 [bacterium]|nr:hypothetical protein [bacterium]